MDKINRQELNILNLNVPEGLVVLINRENINNPNSTQVFQVARLEDINNESDRVDVFLVNWDESTNSVLPFKANAFVDGVFVRDYEIYPTIYKKRKENLMIIE